MYIQDKSQLTETWVRIYGLNSLNHTVEGETEDGSADSDIWSEPYITKRSGSLELEGIKKVTEETGELDPGQEMLDGYAELAGCGADATLKIIDPYGRGYILDCIVTSSEESADDTDQTRSWSLEQVGEAEMIRYIQVKDIGMSAAGMAEGSLTLTAGDAPLLVSVNFEPPEASNHRFRVSNSHRGVVRISEIQEKGFTLTPIGPGTADISVTSVNNAKKAVCRVTVTE